MFISLYTLGFIFSYFKKSNLAWLSAPSRLYFVPLLSKSKSYVFPHYLKHRDCSRHMFFKLIQLKSITITFKSKLWFFLYQNKISQGFRTNLTFSNKFQIFFQININIEIDFNISIDISIILEPHYEHQYQILKHKTLMHAKGT